MSVEQVETTSLEETGSESSPASGNAAISDIRGVEATTLNKRRDFSVSEKVQLLVKYDALPKMSQSKAARELGISKQLVCRILQQRADIMQAWLHNKDTHRKRRRCGKDGEVESALKEWFDRACAEGATVTGPIMRKKAEELARNLGKTDFIATDGWFSRWRKRENIALFGKPRGENSGVLDGQWPEMLATYSAVCIYGAEGSASREQGIEAKVTSAEQISSATNSTPDIHQQHSNPTPETQLMSTGGIQPCQNKRLNLSISEKLEILSKYDALPSMSQRQAALQLGISQPLLSKILNTRHEIMQESLQNAARKRKRCGKDGEVEAALKEWFDQKQREGVSLTGTMMRKKAEELAKQLGKVGFVATDGWFSRWRKRENISTCKVRAPSESSFYPGQISEDVFASTEQGLYQSGYLSENHPVADTNNPSDEATPLQPVSPPTDTNADIDVRPLITSTTSDEYSEWYQDPEKETASPLSTYPPERIYSIEISSVDYVTRHRLGDDFDAPHERIGVLCCVNLSGSKQKLLLVGQRDSRHFRNVRRLPVDYYFHEEARVTPHIIFDWLMKWDRLLDHQIVLMMDDCQDLRAITSFQHLKFMPVPESLRFCGPSLSQNLRCGFEKSKLQRLELLRPRGSDEAVHSTDFSSQSTDFLTLLHMISQSWQNISSTSIRDRFIRSNLLAGRSSENVSMTAESNSSIKAECCDESLSELVVDQQDAAPPANEDTRKALTILSRAVYHRAEEFSLQYQYENFIHSLLQD